VTRLATKQEGMARKKKDDNNLSALRARTLTAFLAHSLGDDRSLLACHGWETVGALGLA